jgi:hypothetical protein
MPNCIILKKTFNLASIHHFTSKCHIPSNLPLSLTQFGQYNYCNFKDELKMIYSFKTFFENQGWKLTPKIP